MFELGNSDSGKNKKGFKFSFDGIDEQTKKILIICVTIFLIIFLIVYFVGRKDGEDYNDIKLDKDKYLVYSKYEKTNSNYKVTTPYVNIKGEAVRQVNKDIDLFVGEFVRAKKSTVTYKYNVSGIILSLVVKVVDFNTEYAPETYFRSYNINLSSQEVISNQALFDYFGTDVTSVEAMIVNKFKGYYEEIVKENYYHEDECNYECFLKHRGIEDYMDRVTYYVKNGDLMAFKPFTTFSLYGEEEYFDDDDFEILIVRTEKN